MTDQPIFTATRASAGRLRSNLNRQAFPLAAWQLSDESAQNGPRIVILLAATALASFLVWAALTPVHEVTEAPGSISPDVAARSIRHPGGGAVARVFVSEGDAVKSGQPLISLDSVQVSSDLARVRLRITEFRERISRLETMSRLGDLASGQSVMAPQVGVGATNTLLSAELDFAAARLKVADQQIAARTKSIEGMAQLKAEAKLTRDLLEREQARLGVLIKKGLMPAADKFRIEQALRQQTEREASLEVESQQAEVGWSEAIARRMEIVQGIREEAMKALDAVSIELGQALEQERGLAHELSQKTIVSPVDGVIHRMAAFGAGDVVGSNELIAEVVPAGASISAVVEVSPTEVGHITVGQLATVDVATYEPRLFGGVSARVEGIAPTARQLREDQSVFDVRIRLDQSHVGPTESGMVITPGMAVTARIETGGKSMLSFLLGPLRDVMHNGFTER